MITFQSRSRELMNSINPKALPEELEALGEDLAALEALVAPRLAAEWISAGGRRSAYPNVTDEQIEDAREWRANNFIRLNKDRTNHYCR